MNPETTEQNSILRSGKRRPVAHYRIPDIEFSPDPAAENRFLECLDITQTQTPAPEEEENVVGRPLKRNSNDPGWEYGELVDLTNKDKVKCLLCGNVYSGGIHRIKRHIAHITGVVAKCEKASDEDKQKCKSMVDAAEDKKKQPKKSRKRKRTEEPVDTQTSSPQEKNGETQDLVKKLLEENEKLVKKNERYWELFEKAFEDNKKLTDENKNLQEVVLQQRELISELERKLEKEREGTVC